ncbi:MAG TPA: hypothetical protein VGM07_12690 [Stellaceae bacterium]|jgi:hypothetical protein
MTRHAYPGAAMVGDYLRAAAGLLPTAAILVLAPLGAVGAAILGGLAALFLVFGLRTALRHRTSIEMTETGLSAASPLRVTILWTELDRIKLAYYSTRRDRRDGWMQLELRAGASVLRLDSRIDGFAELARRAAMAAGARRLALSPATAANLEALGIEAPAFPLAEATGGAMA